MSDKVGYFNIDQLEIVRSPNVESLLNSPNEKGLRVVWVMRGDVTLPLVLGKGDLLECRL